MVARPANEINSSSTVSLYQLKVHEVEAGGTMKVQSRTCPQILVQDQYVYFT